MYREAAKDILTLAGRSNFTPNPGKSYTERLVREKKRKERIELFCGEQREIWLKVQILFANNFKIDFHQQQHSDT